MHAMAIREGHGKHFKWPHARNGILQALILCHCKNASGDRNTLQGEAVARQFKVDTKNPLPQVPAEGECLVENKK